MLRHKNVGKGHTFTRYKGTQTRLQYFWAQVLNGAMNSMRNPSAMARAVSWLVFSFPVCISLVFAIGMQVGVCPSRCAPQHERRPTSLLPRPSLPPRARPLAVIQMFPIQGEDLTLFRGTCIRDEDVHVKMFQPRGLMNGASFKEVRGGKVRASVRPMIAG